MAMGAPDGHTLVTHANNDWNAFPVFWRELEAEFCADEDNNDATQHTGGLAR